MMQIRKQVKRWLLPLGIGLSFSLVATVVAQTTPKSAAVKVKPDATLGKQIATTKGCFACHGEKGQGSADYPALAAQHPEYLVKQLHNFKVAKDAKQPERLNAVMNGQAANLTDDEIIHLAAYFSQQPVVNNVNEVKLPDMYELGRKIYRGGIVEKGVPSCVACHGAAGAGLPSKYPRLSGQHFNYGKNQLLAFRNGARKHPDEKNAIRKNSVEMMGIAARLNDDEIDALASYLAGLK